MGCSFMGEEKSVELGEEFFLAHEIDPVFLTPGFCLGVDHGFPDTNHLAQQSPNLSRGQKALLQGLGIPYREARLDLAYKITGVI